MNILILCLTTKKLKLKETLANKPIVDVKWNKETTYKMSGKIKNKSNVE